MAAFTFLPMQSAGQPPLQTYARDLSTPASCPDAGSKRAERAKAGRIGPGARGNVAPAVSDDEILGKAGRAAFHRLARESCDAGET
jgi:hypothetical protein